MANKKIFQINNLNATVNTYTILLKNLLEQRDTIQHTLDKTTLDTDTTTILGKDTSTTNESEQLLRLLKCKTLLEHEIVELKLNILKCKNEYNTIINVIKSLPNQLTINLQNENNIYTEEITTIDNLLTETEQNYIQNMDNANGNNKLLLIDINNLEIQLNIQNTKIQNLQLEACNYRKQTLQDLHTYKNCKQKIHQQIQDYTTNTINNNINLQHLDTLDTLTIINDNLIKLKTLIIKAYYTNTNTNTNTPDILNILSSDTRTKDDTMSNDTVVGDDTDTGTGTTDTNTNTNTTFYDTDIGNIIKILNFHNIDIGIGINIGIDIGIDTFNTILDIQSYIKNIDIFNKTIVNIDTLIKNNTLKKNTITSNINKIQQIHNIHLTTIKKDLQHNTSRHNKIYSYKDLYKIEKNERDNSQNKYNELKELYDNYDIVVINKIINANNMSIDEYKQYKIKALERLTFITERLNNEYNIELCNLKEQTKLIQTNLHNYNNTLIDINKQLHDINIQLNIIDKNTIDIKNINIKITDISKNIEHIKSNITYIENN